MYDLKVDTEAIQTAINEFQAIYKELDQLKKDLTQAIEDLKATYWQSDGGDAFFKKYDDGWVKNVDTYLAVLEFLEKELGSAKTEYAALIHRANNLDITF